MLFVVEVSVTHEPNRLGLSLKGRILSAILESTAMDFCDPVDRRSIKLLALKLHQETAVELIKNEGIRSMISPSKWRQIDRYQVK